MKRVFVLILPVLLSFVLVLPFSLKAQVGASDISIETTPTSPGAFQSVSMKLVSFSLDLDRAYITWKLDAKVASAGKGMKEFSFKTGDIGSKSTVNITIDAGLGQRFEKNVVFEPSDVDLLWEAVEAHVPPFYKGKALPPMEGAVRVTALPVVKGGISSLGGGNFIYKWKRNDSVDQEHSGFKKNSFYFTSNYLNKTELVSAEVSGTDSNFLSSRQVDIRTASPKVVFYEKSPLGNVLYSNALNSGFKMSGEEVTLVAEPFFMSPEDSLSPSISYKWNMNDTPIENQFRKNEVTLRSGGQ